MGLKRERWRLLLHGASDGATNMAIDEAIGTLVASGRSLPTLRFYAWRPYTVSLGRHQPLEEIDLEACARLGYGVVRRITGGRAVLHAEELTYSVSAPRDNPRMTGGVLDAYRFLSMGLIEGLRILGVPVEQAGPEARAGEDVSAACFEVPSAYEITVEGRKLIGSAQSRRQGFVLQHGAIPLGGDVAEIVECLALAPDEREELRRALRSRATTLKEALGRRVTFGEAALAMARGFARALNLELVPDGLTAEEQKLAVELREKYLEP